METPAGSSRRALMAGAPLAAVLALAKQPAKAKKKAQAKKAKGLVRGVRVSDPVQVTITTTGVASPRIPCNPPRKGERAYAIGTVYDLQPNGVTIVGSEPGGGDGWVYSLINTSGAERTVTLSVLCLYVGK